MKFAFVSLVVAVLAAGVNSQNQLTINTPQNVVECEPILLTWLGGTPPYFLSILPGGQPGAAAVEDFGQQNGTSLTWNANVAAGTSLGLTLRDSTGATAESAAFTVLAGSSSACVTQPPSTSAGAAVPTTATPGGTSSTAPAGTTTAPAGTTTTKSSTTTTGTGTTGSSSPTSKSGAMPTALFAQAGFAGVVGAVIAAIVA